MLQHTLVCSTYHSREGEMKRPVACAVGVDEEDDEEDDDDEGGVAILVMRVCTAEGKVRIASINA